ncbi:class I SAM-dependent methyltransferase [Candidatus Pelagibacter sp.]|nr:class I SAM-dependent methyltransferase [Candidatus Pelagibacter sp.]
MNEVKIFFLSLFKGRQSIFIKYLSIFWTTIKYVNLLRKVDLWLSIILIPKIIKSQFFLEFHSNFNRERIDNVNYFEDKYNFLYPDWFGSKILVWSKIFRKFRQNINYLEIGSFEGRSAVFVSEQPNINSITCVDTFEGGDEHSDINFQKVLLNINNNLKKSPCNNYKIIQNNSNQFFLGNTRKFDVIYIDGSHYYQDVKSDFINSMKFLKIDGILICDDFFWTYYSNIKDNPINAILECYLKYKNELEIIFVNYQIIFKKIK